MKIGIITLFSNGNYGASLQAYALNRVVTDLGAECRDIRYNRISRGRTDSGNNWKMRFSLLADRNGRALFMKKAFLRLKYGEKLKRRRKKFLRFETTFIPQTEQIYTGVNELANAELDFDKFICGSDNIWNIHNYDPAYILSFVEDSSRKFSYAAGFSVTSLPAAQVKELMPLISRLSVISIRESDGYQFLRDYFPEEKLRLDLDPTLLLSPAQWSGISQKINHLPPEYIFCYIIGDETDARNAAKELSKETGIPIVNIPHATTLQISDRGFGDDELFDVGPQEFIYLIQNAKYIITDSYHGCIFSMLFHKKYLVFERFKEVDGKANLNIRIKNLLDQFFVFERLMVNPESNVKDAMESPIDYDAFDSKLSDLRSDSIYYLESICKGGEQIE